MVATVAVGCSSAVTEPDEKGDTASLIVGGTAASIEAWPGMAQLETAQGPQCGATLIAPEWVVSAAHCFNVGQRNGGWTRVAFGRQNSNAGGGEVVTVAQAFQHQQYSDATMNNDIALIKLSRPVTRQPAKVMTASDWATLGKAGTQLTVVGWGATREGGNMVADLRQVTVPLIGNAECASMNIAGATLGEKMLCAGFPNGGRDACQGDSGGPLFMPVGGTPVQVGIVSFGEGCARANAPGIYTQIAGYYDWINQNTNNALGPATPPPTQPTTPDSTTSNDTEESPVETQPTNTGDVDTTTGDVDEPTGSSDDDEDDEDEPTPKPKKKKKKSARSAAYQTQGCAMTTGLPTTGSAGSAAGLLLLGVALVHRRRRAS
ncbi:MAG: serine protease [Labilithrix sp.]|nr:serine protease [Labilithrix sp.]MCW5817394.1 serine protease [Labilithrix sp.]